MSKRNVMVDLEMLSRGLRKEVTKPFEYGSGGTAARRSHGVGAECGGEHGWELISIGSNTKTIQHEITANERPWDSHSPTTRCKCGA